MSDIVEVLSTIEVEAHIQRWTITNDDIYIVNRKTEPPDWYKNLIGDIIDQSGTYWPIDGADGLNNRFAGIDEGYSNVVYGYTEGDKDLLVHVETLYTTNAEYNAGISNLSGVYLSQKEAGAFVNNTIGAWLTGGEGAAWFNESISTVASHAYAAAQSAQNLTASIKQTDINLGLIGQDLADLNSQIDKTIDSYFYHNDVNIGPTGGVCGNPLVSVAPDSINTCAEPYVNWLVPDVRIKKLQDAYVLLEVLDDKVTKSWTFSKANVPNSLTDADGYYWLANNDPAVNDIYQKIADNRILGDSKVSTYVGSVPPHHTKMCVDIGDMWFDTANGDMLKIYMDASPTHDCNESPPINGGNFGWVETTDKRLIASVRRLDEVTVGIDPNPAWVDDGIQSDPDAAGEPRFAGGSRAKSSLVVESNGTGGYAAAGFVVSADNVNGSASSSFRIFADKFEVCSTADQGVVPFSVANRPGLDPLITLDGNVVVGNNSLVEMGKFLGIFATAPANKIIGDSYENSTDSVIYVWNGVVWNSTKGGSGAPGSSGARGSMIIYISGTWPSNPNAYFPGGPILYDVLVATSSTVGQDSRQYNGSSWVALAMYVNGNVVVDGTITGNHIQANSITSAKIVAGTIVASDIAANTITANQIAANAITASELSAGAITANDITSGTMNAARINGGDINGVTITGNTINGGTINGITLNINDINIKDSRGTIAASFGGLFFQTQSGVGGTVSYTSDIVGYYSSSEFRLRATGGYVSMLGDQDTALTSFHDTQAGWSALCASSSYITVTVYGGNTSLGTYKFTSSTDRTIGGFRFRCVRDTGAQNDYLVHVANHYKIVQSNSGYIKFVITSSNNLNNTAPSFGYLVSNI